MSTPWSDNSYSSFNHAKPHVLFIMFMFCLLGGPYKFVYRIRAVQIWFFEYNSLILTTGCSTCHLTAKNSLRIWKKIFCSPQRCEAIRSSVTAWNRVTVQWPGSYRGFQRRVSLGTDLARVDQRSRVLVLCIRCRSWLQKNRCMSAQHCFRGRRSAHVSLSVLRLCRTLQQVGLHGRRPRRMLFWSWLTKKPGKSLLKITWPRAMNGWNHVLGLMSLRLTLFDCLMVSSTV